MDGETQCGGSVELFSLIAGDNTSNGGRRTGKLSILIAGDNTSNGREKRKLVAKDFVSSFTEFANETLAEVGLVTNRRNKQRTRAQSYLVTRAIHNWLECQDAAFFRLTLLIIVTNMHYNN